MVKVGDTVEVVDIDHMDKQFFSKGDKGVVLRIEQKEAYIDFNPFADKNKFIDHDGEWYSHVDYLKVIEEA